VSLYFGRQFMVQLDIIFTDETVQNGKEDIYPLSISLIMGPSFLLKAFVFVVV
jgi:hypothetical protein